MSIEIEAKLKVDSHDALRHKLSAVGATRISRVLEQNHIFDNPGRTMLKADCGLRVRVCHDDDGRILNTTVTYKGPRAKGRLKTRPEIQFHADDDSSAIDFLKALGFVEAITFEKRRETWQLNDCRIELDELPYIGLYVEIEGPSESAIAHTQQAIGLNHLSHEPRSYIAMLIDHCRQHNMPIDHLKF